MNVQLVKHDKVGTGYALQETDGRWVVRFHQNYSKHFVFTKNVFKVGYLKDLGIVNIGAFNGQKLSNHSENRRTTSP